MKEREITIMQGTPDDEGVPRIVITLPGELPLLNQLLVEQRIYCCGFPGEPVEGGCGDDIYHLLESLVWKTEDHWQELEERIQELQTKNPLDI